MAASCGIDMAGLSSAMPNLQSRSLEITMTALASRVLMTLRRLAWEWPYGWSISSCYYPPALMTMRRPLHLTIRADPYSFIAGAALIPKAGKPVESCQGVPSMR